MKIYLHFKTPDVVGDAVDNALPFPEIRDEEACGEIQEERRAIKQRINRFIQYGENATLCFDTETGKMEVMGKE
jgi:hypothetical protein